jgi:hypothetical protein
MACYQRPTALIFLPKTDCGLNFKKISDLAQIQKWGMLGRNSALGLASAAVTHSLIKRATETPSSTVLFATSLVEWGSLNRMQLSQTAPGPRSLTNDKCEELIEQLMLTEEDIQNSPIGGIFSDGRDRNPEKRLPDRSMWSDFDKGIHIIADAAADSVDAILSEVLTSAPSPIKVSVKCDDILREILADGVWHWTYEDSDESSPVLDDIMRHINFCALQQYTEKRDNVYRADAELPPKWEGINPNLAYSCLPSEPTNTRQFIQTAGRIWHKSYRYGTNRLKGILNSVEASQASICALCNRVEDPSHIYSRCKHPFLRRLQEATFDIQTRALARLCTDPGCPTWERSFFRKFHKWTFSHRHDRAETCWNGTLNPSDLQSLLSSRMPPPVSISFAKFQEFRKRFNKFVSPLSEAAVQMEMLQHQSRLRAALRHLPSLRRRTTAANRSPIPSIHPSFRPTTPASVL